MLISGLESKPSMQEVLLILELTGFWVVIIHSSKAPIQTLQNCWKELAPGSSFIYATVQAN